MTVSNMYQGIGVISGRVCIETEYNKEAVYIYIKSKNVEKKYKIYYIKKYIKSFDALKLEIKKSTDKLRLIVYPKIFHLPENNKLHKLVFQLVGFDCGKDKGISKHLEDNMFILNGKWQFIPTCKFPVITIHKNYSKERVEYYKTLEETGKRRLAKATHVPVFWEHPIVEPFRFNHRLDKQQQDKLYFVKIKARFLPDKDAFVFDTLTEIPTEEIPRFIKFKRKKHIKQNFEEKEKEKVNN